MSVNTMASNLTTQVRGFAQISAAAMDGDFSRFITVEANGEMDSLKTQTGTCAAPRRARSTQRTRGQRAQPIRCASGNRRRP